MTDKIKISYDADSNTTLEIQTFLQSIAPNVEIISEPIIEDFEEDFDLEVKQLLPEELEAAKNKFKQADWNVREEAALDLAITRNPDARALLLLQINDPQPEVKHMVIYALGRIIGTPTQVKEIIATLIEFLTDTDFETRLVTVQALGKIASQFANSTTDTQGIITYLLESLKTEDDWCVKKAIAQAFSIIPIDNTNDSSQAILQALKKLQQDENVFVKRAAFAAASKIEEKTAASAIEEEKTPTQTQLTVLQWLEKALEDLLSTGSYLGWLLGEQRQLAGVIAQGNNNDVSSKYIYKNLTIAGQSYQLQVIRQNQDAPNAYLFKLVNRDPGKKIPGGFKLILLSSEGEAFEGNTDVAKSATDSLEIQVTLAPGVGVIWKTEPLPENYVEEILRL